MSAETNPSPFEPHRSSRKGYVPIMETKPRDCLRCGKAFGGKVIYRARRLCTRCYRWAEANGQLDKFELLRNPAVPGPRLPTRDPSAHWISQALCAEVDPELFFPDHAEADKYLEIVAPICRTCPVNADCAAARIRTEAANPGTGRGIWAGTYHSYVGKHR